MMSLDTVSTAVRARVSYLRCTTDAEADRDGWIGCAELISDPARLAREIDATAEGRRSTDPQVLASLFVQAYAFRIPSIAVAAWAIGLPSPSTAPESTLMRITRSRPGEVAVLDDRLRQHDAASLATEVIDHHLAPLIATARAATRVGARLLWGNVAASIATIFRAVQSSGPLGDQTVRDRATDFFAAATQLDRLGAWSTIEVPGALGWYWDRTACCLWYQTASASLCDDCSLHDDIERNDRRRRELVAGAEATR